jgi:hypothetical protein
MSTVMSWPLKRSAFGRLARISAGMDPPPYGAELLVSTADRPVEVSLFLPAEPERICVFGTPLSFSRREASGESAQWAGNTIISGIEVETVRLEVRVRVYEPGEDFDSVDRTLGDMCSAVVSALKSAPLADRTNLYLSGGSQDPTAMAPAPEPSVTGNAVLVFTGEVITL